MAWRRPPSSHSMRCRLSPEDPFLRLSPSARAAFAMLLHHTAGQRLVDVFRRHRTDGPGCGVSGTGGYLSRSAVHDMMSSVQSGQGRGGEGKKRGVGKETMNRSRTGSRHSNDTPSPAAASASRGRGDSVPSSSCGSCQSEISICCPSPPPPLFHARGRSAGALTF